VREPAPHPLDDPVRGLVERAPGGVEQLDGRVEGGRGAAQPVVEPDRLGDARLVPAPPGRAGPAGLERSTSGPATSAGGDLAHDGALRPPLELLRPHRPDQHDRPPAGG